MTHFNCGVLVGFLEEHPNPKSAYFYPSSSDFSEFSVSCMAMNEFLGCGSRNKVLYFSSGSHHWQISQGNSFSVSLGWKKGGWSGWKDRRM